MRRLGIFGGRFDPPHIGHLIHARLVFENFNLDKILFIPAFTPPHKDVCANFKDRSEMVKLAFTKETGFELSRIEQEEKTSYTIDTLDKLKKRHPDADFFLIIGQDEYEAWETWHQPDEILKSVELIVLPRSKQASSTKPGVHFPDLPLIEISSTTIRERISKGRPVTNWIPEGVERYIKEKKLYKESHG